jgi:FkbM family methyltransferase
MSILNFPFRLRHAIRDLNSSVLVLSHQTQSDLNSLMSEIKIQRDLILAINMRLDAFEKSYFLSQSHIDILLSRQVSRPYYDLSGKWGLTQLSTGQPFFIDKDTRDIAPWILLGGTWENFVDDLLCALVDAGDTFLDVGANLGYYTIKMGGRVGPGGRVFSFEPNPAMFETLQENININGFAGRAEAFNAAAGAAAGRLAFSVDHSHPGGGTVHPHPSAEGTADVAVVAIDDALPQDVVVDLIKIDVEGFEPMVFDGMARLLARSPQAAIVCEFSYGGWERFGEPVAMLRRYAEGRRLFRIFHDGRLREEPETGLAEIPDRNFTAYFLMLPKTPRRSLQLDAYMRKFSPP